MIAYGLGDARAVILNRHHNRKRHRVGIFGANTVATAVAGAERYDDILNHYGRENGVMIARKHIGWYSAGLFDSTSYRSRINSLTDPELIKQEIRDFYQSALDKPVTAELPVQEGSEGYACAA